MKILRQPGYETAVGQYVEGFCISHEMDVAASNINEKWLIECKYAGDQGKLVSIQIPLHVLARIDDIIQKEKGCPNSGTLLFRGA